MFENLVGFTPDIEEVEALTTDFEPVKRVVPSKLLNAQQLTSQWLSELGAPGDEEVIGTQQKEAAREAFAVVTTGADPEKQKTSLLKIHSPAAMAHLNTLLTAHDWEFVERAKELRSYAVTKIIKETEHVDARIRLRALELLGKVTEIGLFTDRVEIKKVEVGDHELEARVREKLQKFLIQAGDLEDVEPKAETVENPDTELEAVMQGKEGANAKPPEETPA